MIGREDLNKLKDIFKDVDLTKEQEENFVNWLKPFVTPKKLFVDPTYKFVVKLKDDLYSMWWTYTLYRWENNSWMYINKWVDTKEVAYRVVNQLKKEGNLIIFE